MILAIIWLIVAVVWFASAVRSLVEQRYAGAFVDALLASSIAYIGFLFLAAA